MVQFLGIKFVLSTCYFHTVLPLSRVLVKILTVKLLYIVLGVWLQCPLQKDLWNCARIEQNSCFRMHALTFTATRPFLLHLDHCSHFTLSVLLSLCLYTPFLHRRSYSKRARIMDPVISNDLSDWARCTASICSVVLRPHPGALPYEEWSCVGRLIVAVLWP